MSNYFSAGLGFIGGLLGNAQQSANIDKQISAQKAEHQKNREYNFRLAQQQNQWNLEQWIRENDYNSPKSQMQRFREAGLNPDMMMSDGSQNLSASSPQLTSGAPSTPADLSNLANKPTISEAIDRALNSSLVTSETKKNLAEADTLVKQLEVMANSIWKMQAETGLLNQQEVTEFNKQFIQEKEVNILAEELKIKQSEARHIEETIISNLLLQRETVVKFGKEAYMLQMQGDKLKIEKVYQEKINELVGKYGETNVILDAGIKATALQMSSKDFENYWWNKVLGVASSSLQGAVGAGIKLLK